MNKLEREINSRGISKYELSEKLKIPVEKFRCVENLNSDELKRIFLEIGIANPINFFNEMVDETSTKCTT